MFVLSQCYGQLFAVLEQHYYIYENNVKSAISRYVECEFVDQYLIYYTTPAYEGSIRAREYTARNIFQF